MTTFDGAENLERLQAFLGSELGASTPQISGLTKAELGRSRENWLFDAVWQDGEQQTHEPLIVRRDPLGGLVDTERSTEFALLRALENTCVPSPRARWLDADGSWLGRPSLIMHREVGASEYYVLNGDRPLEDRVALAERFCDLLADVHTADWQAAGVGEVFDDPGPWASLAELSRWEEVLHRDQLEAMPELELAVHGLRASAPRAQATVLVHADFKPGNVLLDGTRIVALLDWELAHLGDPMEDLGWVTQPLRQREHLIPGAWEPVQLMERYRRATGFEVDEDSVRWWNAFATFRTAVMQVSALRSYLDGRSDESYRPTVQVLRALLDGIGS